MALADRGPWRDLPCEYGPWQTVYGLFRRWQRQCV
ncbi:transposase [Streptomyces scopuliridis]